MAGPVLDAITLQLYGRWIRAGIVGTHYLDRTAITGTVFLDNNNAVVGLLTRSDARQTDHQHLKKPLMFLIWGDLLSPAALAGWDEWYEPNT
jgi:hypothetical protein